MWILWLKGIKKDVEYQIHIQVNQIIFLSLFLCFFFAIRLFSFSFVINLFTMTIEMKPFRPSIFT